MAVAKKAKAAPSKSKSAKASTNKKAPAKPATKPAGSKAVTKKSPAKKAVPAKVVKTTPAKKASKSAAAPLKAKTVSKAAPAKPVAKPVAKTGPVKQAAKPVEKPTAAKKEAPKKDTKAVPPVSKKPAATASALEKKLVTPAKTPASKAAPASPASKVKSEAVKTVPAKPATAKSSGKQPEKKLIVAPKPSDEFPDMDPADAKAKKIMRELEETMDLAKMKPRIKVPTPAKTITRHVNHPPLKLVEPTHTNKQKFSLEFEFRSSPKILFNALSDSSGLAGWFADEVRTKDDQFTFVWEGGESYARLVAIKDMFLVRFQWAEDTDGTYFQFEIKQDELTGEIALVITDFALPGERETNIRLWESQVQNLRMLLGSL